MAYSNTLKIYEIIRPAFDENQSTKIAEAIEIALETNNAVLLDKVATKEDIANLKSEVIKWMFIFWIGQFAAIVGTLSVILFAFFKK